VPEREVKLAAAPSFRLPALDDVAGGVVDAQPARSLTATYFDTDDLRLTRWGVSLRYRTNDGWTVKLPQGREGQMLVRDEIVFEGDPDRTPEEAVDLVSAFARGAALRPQVRLETVRRETALRGGDGRLVADVVDDDVTVVDNGTATRPFRELEVEIADDGRGGAEAGKGEGTGLRGLADRVEALGGRLEIDSPPGEGTTLRASIPVTRG